MPIAVNRFPNKLATKVPYKVPENIPFCSFASFLLTPFIKEPDSSRDLTIFIYHSSLNLKLLMWFSLLSPKS